MPQSSTMSLFGQSKRPSSSSKSNGRRIGLPLSSIDTHDHHNFNNNSSSNKSFMSHSRRGSLTSPMATASTSSGWFTVLYIPIPAVSIFGTRRNGAGTAGLGSIGMGMGMGMNGDGRLGIPQSHSHSNDGYLPSSSSSSTSYYPSSASPAYPQQPKRHLKVYLPIPHAVLSRIPFLSRPTPLRLIALLAMIITLVLLVTGVKRGKLNSGGGGGWTEVFGGDGEKEGGVLTKEEVARIWEWEVISGHHPSLADGEYHDHAG